MVFNIRIIKQMKMNFKVFCCAGYLVSLIAVGCSFDSEKRKGNNSLKKDAQNVDIPLDSLPKMSLPELELNNFRSIKDTIVFTSPTPFLYFPLGTFKREIGILNDYPELQLSPQKYVNDTGPVELYKYRYKQSFIKMIKNDESGLFDIVFARLVDNGIILKNGVAIGSLKSNFVKKFFKPIVNLKNYNVVKIESLILGITHMYSFKGDKLVEIIIDSDYQVDKD